MIVSVIFGYVTGMHMTFEKIRAVFGDEMWRMILEGLHFDVEHGEEKEKENEN